MDTIKHNNPSYRPDLISQLALADRNYLRLTKLIGNLDYFHSLTLYWPDTHIHPTRCCLQLKLLERYKHTLTLQLQLEQGMPWYTTPMVVRIYRDMRMADVVKGTIGHQYNNHYDYPNNQGHMINEKVQHNNHLAKILQHALNEGMTLHKETHSHV